MITIQGMNLYVKISDQWVLAKQIRKSPITGYVSVSLIEDGPGVYKKETKVTIGPGEYRTVEKHKLLNK